MVRHARQARLAGVGAEGQAQHRGAPRSTSARRASRPTWRRATSPGPESALRASPRGGAGRRRPGRRRGRAGRGRAVASGTRAPIRWDSTTPAHSELARGGPVRSRTRCETSSESPRDRARAAVSSPWSTPSATRRSCACGGWRRDVPDVEVWAKLEFANPGGSVKDRPALRMILDALADGRLTRDKILIDSTSGNTGVAYSLYGAALGVRVRLVMPSNVSKAAQGHRAELRHRDRLQRSHGGLRRGHPRRARARREGPRRLLLPGPVLEPVQLARPLRRHRPRDPRRRGRPPHPLRGGPGHDRHDDGLRPAAEGALAPGRVRRGRAGRRAARARGPQAPREQPRPGHLRSPRARTAC